MRKSYSGSPGKIFPGVTLCVECQAYQERQENIMHKSVAEHIDLIPDEHDGHSENRNLCICAGKWRVNYSIPFMATAFLALFFN